MQVKLIGEFEKLDNFELACSFLKANILNLDLVLANMDGNVVLGDFSLLLENILSNLEDCSCKVCAFLNDFKLFNSCQNCSKECEGSGIPEELEHRPSV